MHYLITIEIRRIKAANDKRVRNATANHAGLRATHGIVRARSSCVGGAGAHGASLREDPSSLGRAAEFSSVQAIPWPGV